MAYNNFTLQQLIKTFNLSLHEPSNYFSDRTPQPASPSLADALEENIDLEKILGILQNALQ